MKPFIRNDNNKKIMQSNSNDDVAGFDNHNITEPSNKNPKDDNDVTPSSSNNNNENQEETTDIEPEDTSSATKYYTNFFLA